MYVPVCKYMIHVCSVVFTVAINDGVSVAAEFSKKFKQLSALVCDVTFDLVISVTIDVTIGVMVIVYISALKVLE